MITSVAFCFRRVKFKVPTVDVTGFFFTYCKFLILAYDDRKVRSFRGTGCQSYGKVTIIIATTYDDSRAKIAMWNDPQVDFL